MTVPIVVSPRVADKLNRLAEREHKTVEEVIERLLEGQATPEKISNKPRPGSGAALLKSALEADIHAGDLAGKSREILDNGFADDFWNRIHDELNEDTKS